MTLQIKAIWGARAIPLQSNNYCTIYPGVPDKRACERPVKGNKKQPKIFSPKSMADKGIVSGFTISVGRSNHNNSQTFTVVLMIGLPNLIVHST